MKGTDIPQAKQYVKYVPVGYVSTHVTAVGYLLWLIGFTGAHRFYFGKTLSGAIWFFTFGLFGIGWLIDFFLIPSMNQDTQQQYVPGSTDYSLAWILLLFFGVFGIHRFYQGKLVTGAVYLLTGGLFGVGYVYDVLTLNDQISNRNQKSMTYMHQYQYHPQMAW